MTGQDTSRLQECLDRLRQGDPAARQALLENSLERLRLLTRKMLRQFPGVRRWEETDDVLQEVLLRLDRMLRDVTIVSVRDYLRLAATHIRRELIDLVRHYSGPQGLGANHATPRERGDGASGPLPADKEADSSSDPSTLLGWSELHRQVGLLPDEECEVFDLLWYQGVTQDQAAVLLHISTSTIKRRWQSARLNLMRALGGELPF